MFIVHSWPDKTSFPFGSHIHCVFVKISILSPQGHVENDMEVAFLIFAGHHLERGDAPGWRRHFKPVPQPTIQKHNPAEQTSPRSTFAVVGSTLSAPPARAPDIKVGSRAGAPHCLVSRNVNNYHEREWQVFIKIKKGKSTKIQNIQNQPSPGY